MVSVAWTDLSTMAAAFAGGASLLAAGLSLGWCWGRFMTRAAQSRDVDRERISDLLAPILAWANGISTDVSEYRTLIEAISEQIAREADQSAEPSIKATASLLAQMLEANRNLQARLDNAEATLQQQSTEIAAYISQARTDALTGLNNRRVFDEHLAASLAAWHAQGKPLGLVLFDIDHFKILNDTQGHLAGDAVLREVAALLKQHAPPGALLARYGGEEFACIVSGDCEDEVCQGAERLRATVEETLFVYERTSLRVTISCGVAQATFSECAAGLLKRGDNALYAAKSAGRNAVYRHDGYRCVPYTVQGRADHHLAEEEQFVQDFHSVCDDLRSRLAQIAIDPVAQEV